MVVASIILLALIVVGGICYLHYRLTPEDEKTDAAEATAQDTEADESECCGMHITCERDSLLATVSDKIEYYDDEELDVFAGRQPDSYDEAETEQFRDVLLTLLPDDIAGWSRSIQLRGIELPTVVRDELFLIITEERQRRAGN